MPPGTHRISLNWAWPDRTPQKLSATYTLTIENPLYGKTEDTQIAEAVKAYGTDKVVVLQNGRKLLGGNVYEGTSDIMIGKGGFQNMYEKQIFPDARKIDVGPGPKGKYCRILMRFDLAPLEGKKIKQAWLKLTLPPNEKFCTEKVEYAVPIHPLLKPWQEGTGDEIAVGSKRRNKVYGEGLPNGAFRAYPEKWEGHSASGPADQGPLAASLEADADATPPAGAKADLTKLVQAWLAGEMENHGVVIGHVPEEASKSKGQLCFFSSEEYWDLDYRPRLIVVLE